MSKSKKEYNYAIVQNTNLELHCKQCNELLEKGYTPLGGPSVVDSAKANHSLIITQAFIKEYTKDLKKNKE